MALSFSDPSIQFRHNLGSLNAVIQDITLDSSYPSNGYSISSQKVGLKKVYGAQFLGFSGPSAAGISHLAWDVLNNKLLAIAQAGASPIIVEESVTLTSHTGRLAKVPAYIFTAHASAGGTTGLLRIVPVGEIPATKQCAVNFATGAVTTAAADAVTTAKFSYIPLGVGAFIEANRVVDETRTASASKVNLANRAAMVQYVYDDTDGVLDTLIPVGEAPAATHQCSIDLNDSGNTSLDTHTDDDGNTLKVTYWKFSAIGLDYGWTDQADFTGTTSFAFTELADLPTIWIPGFGVIIVGETGAAANVESAMVGPSGTVAADMCVYDPNKNLLTAHTDDAFATIEMPYVTLNPGQAVGGGGQVPAGTNLSSVVARVMFYGI